MKPGKNKKNPETEFRIACVIPCYKERDHILEVIAEVGPEVSHIIIVDDACPDQTGTYVMDNNDDPRVEVIVQQHNTGVGGATLAGYGRASELDVDVIVKLDGDGQMDTSLIPALVRPIQEGHADYCKGNRFEHMDNISAMPKSRIIGNIVLSFMTKLSSGYWNIFDPTNGFTAIHIEAARRLPVDHISNSFFFESDMLYRLGMLRAVVVDIPMSARYGREVSSLNIYKIIPEFTWKHSINSCKRIFFTYFIQQVNFASFQLVVGKLMLLFGVIFGAIKWNQSSVENIPATAGTVILAALPVILGTQFLISFINFDTQNIPKVPLHKRIKGHVAKP